MDAIQISGVWKRYKSYKDKSYSLKDSLLFWNRNKFDYRWVLKNVSFSVKKGEGIGLIGENGCGKSTLLKLMTKIIYPNQGTITMNGRVSSLIELGAGFHPEMSGRENIYTNAAIFGLSREEIDEKIGDIIEFSELGDFIESPVRTYSSGMYMRLAFAVAINVNADILLIDEILAVGDANFQAKCFEKLKEVKRKGTTVVIVSHSLSQIEEICERSAWIENGSIKQIGTPEEVHLKYLEYMRAKREESLIEGGESPAMTTDPLALLRGKAKQGQSGTLRLRGAITNENWDEFYNTYTGQSLYIRLFYKTDNEIPQAKFLISFYNSEGVLCYQTDTQVDGVVGLGMRRQGMVLYELNHLELLPGTYSVDVEAGSQDGTFWEKFPNLIRFTVASEIQDIGIARLSHVWNYIEADYLE